MYEVFTGVESDQQMIILKDRRFLWDGLMEF